VEVPQPIADALLEPAVGPPPDLAVGEQRQQLGDVALLLGDHPLEDAHAGLIDVWRGGFEVAA